jgi:uncharacterized OB-fold protein
MTVDNTLAGKVCSHTVIRMPGKAHAGVAPFVLLLVELDDGKRLLGHFKGSEPPRIDTRVRSENENPTPIFTTLPESP